METLAQPKETKARKEHRCDFCNDKIVIREKYIKSTHIYEGQVYDWKTHKHCSELATELNMYDDCDEGLTQDIFMEIVNSQHYEILISKMPDEDVIKYGDILGELRYVRFRNKLGFVIRHLKKLSNNN